jgi:hypothetical protein
MKRAAGMALLVAVMVLATGMQASASNPNGSGGDMPACYDGQLFAINFKLLKPDPHPNKSFNTIYQCDSCAASGLVFVSVLDAIQETVQPRMGRGSDHLQPGVPASAAHLRHRYLGCSGAGGGHPDRHRGVLQMVGVGPKKQFVATTRPGAGDHVRRPEPYTDGSTASSRSSPRSSSPGPSSTGSPRAARSSRRRASPTG